MFPHQDSSFPQIQGDVDSLAKYRSLFLSLKEALQKIRQKNTMRREVTVELSSQGFWKTGIRSDVCQVSWSSFCLARGWWKSVLTKAVSNLWNTNEEEHGSQILKIQQIYYCGSNPGETQYSFHFFFWGKQKVLHRVLIIPFPFGIVLKNIYTAAHKPLNCDQFVVT